MAGTRKTKDPADLTDYTLSWTEWLVGDTITTSTWTVPTGIAIEASTHDGSIVTFWLSGGTLGQTYTLTNQIVTAGGRIAEADYLIVMINRQAG